MADYLHKVSACITHLHSNYYENIKMSSQAGHIAQAVFLEDISMISRKFLKISLCYIEDDLLLIRFMVL